MYKLGLYIKPYIKYGQCFIWGFLVLFFFVYNNLKSNHRLLFLAIFPDLEILQFWSENYTFQVCKLYFCLGHVQNFGHYLYLSVFSKQYKCPKFSFVKYVLYSHCTENCIFFGTFWRLKTLVLWRKFFHNLLIFAYLFCSKNKTIDSGKTSITLAWLVVESCPTPRWITFLMLYRLMYNIRSYFNDLILAWSTYWDSFWQLKALKKWWKMMCVLS